MTMHSHLGEDDIAQQVIMTPRRRAPPTRWCEMNTAAAPADLSAFRVFQVEEDAGPEFVDQERSLIRQPMDGWAWRQIIDGACLSKRSSSVFREDGARTDGREGYY